MTTVCFSLKGFRAGYGFVVVRVRRWRWWVEIVGWDGRLHGGMDVGLCSRVMDDSWFGIDRVSVTDLRAAWSFFVFLGGGKGSGVGDCGGSGGNINSETASTGRGGDDDSGSGSEMTAAAAVVRLRTG